MPPNNLNLNYKNSLISLQNNSIILLQMSKIFHEKWDKVYRLAKQKLSFPVDESTLFGPI